MLHEILWREEKDEYGKIGLGNLGDRRFMIESSIRNNTLILYPCNYNLSCWAFCVPTHCYVGKPTKCNNFGRPKNTPLY